MSWHEVGGLIREARERTKLKQDGLAQRVGCSAPYITMLEKGRSLPSPEMAVRLERALSLKSGKLLQPVLALRMRPDTAATVAHHVANGHATPPSDPHVSLPLLSVCPISATFIAQVETEGWVAVPQPIVRGRRMYVLRVVGDGMDRAELDDGDLVLVDADASPRNGDIVVARLRGRSTIRRFVRGDSGTALAPESSNPAHTPLPLSGTDEAPWRGIVEAIYLKRLK